MSYTDNKDNITRSFFQCMQRIRHGLKNAFQTMPTVEFQTMFSLRSLIEEEKTDAIPVSHLLKKNNTSPQAMSKMLKTLETKGYVERHTSPANRRNTLVTITEQGQMLLKATEENATNFVAELTEKIGVDKMKAYIELSKSFFDAYEDVRKNFKVKEVDCNG